MPSYAPIPYLAPEYLHFLPAPQYTPTPPDGPSTPLTPLHTLVFYHCHFATDCLHEYVQFTPYHL